MQDDDAGEADAHAQAEGRIMLDQPAQPPDRQARRRQQHREAMRRNTSSRFDDYG
jgi:hypothetical protein